MVVQALTECKDYYGHRFFTRQ